MTQDFVTGVQSIVEPLLSKLGFQFDEYIDNIEEGRSDSSAIFYRSGDCKIQIYDSARGGEINCMIAPLDAANKFGLYDKSAKWQYLPRFARRKGVPIEEIRKYNTAVKFPTTDQFLESVRARIDRFFPIAHEGVLEMGGPEWWGSKPQAQDKPR